MCDLGGGIAPGPVIDGEGVMLATVERGITFVAGIEVVEIVAAVEDAAHKMDVGWVEDVDELDTSKHETFVPLFTEKRDEAVEFPAMVAKNQYDPCATFTLGHVQLELDALRSVASLDVVNGICVVRAKILSGPGVVITPFTMERLKSVS